MHTAYRVEGLGFGVEGLGCGIGGGEHKASSCMKKALCSESSFKF